METDLQVFGIARVSHFSLYFTQIGAFLSSPFVVSRYLVKNGSERVIDDARAHLSLIKVLRNFHYTDEAGKDQGINGSFLNSTAPPP